MAPPRKLLVKDFVSSNRKFLERLPPPSPGPLRFQPTVSARANLLAMYMPDTAAFLSSCGILLATSSLGYSLFAGLVAHGTTEYLLKPPLPEPPKDLKEAFTELCRNPLFAKLREELDYPLHFSYAGEEEFRNAGKSQSFVQFKKSGSSYAYSISIRKGEKNLFQPITLLLFESVNAFQSVNFDPLHLKKKNLSKKEYVIRKEYIEWQTSKIFRQIVRYGVERMGWRREWFNGYSSEKAIDDEDPNEFNIYWEKSLVPSGHAGLYAAQWYVSCFSDEEADKECDSPLPEGFFPLKSVAEEMVLLPPMELCLRVSEPAKEDRLRTHLSGKMEVCRRFISECLSRERGSLTVSMLKGSFQGRFFLSLLQDHLEDEGKGEKVKDDRLSEILASWQRKEKCYVKGSLLFSEPPRKPIKKRPKASRIRKKPF